MRFGAIVALCSCRTDRRLGWGYCPVLCSQTSSPLTTLSSLLQYLVLLEGGWGGRLVRWSRESLFSYIIEKEVRMTVDINDFVRRGLES